MSKDLRSGNDRALIIGCRNPLPNHESNRPMTNADPSRISVAALTNAFLGTLIVLICGDALAGAFVYIALDSIVPPGEPMIWLEGGVLFLSLIPAIWVFRAALASERTMLDPPAEKDPARDD